VEPQWSKEPGYPSRRRLDAGGLAGIAQKVPRYDYEAADRDPRPAVKDVGDLPVHYAADEVRREVRTAYMDRDNHQEEDYPEDLNAAFSRQH
jgi:hypothetical protein